KVLASAEKFVQQGKLQNAITEYEKITREDPKDLTVLNTIGDLYLRVGHNEHAAMYFKKVGEQYAQNGFNVKAIAVYKKLVKLQPNNAEITSRLAELYAQQGLISDARAQYTHIAEAFLRAGDNNQAARVMQRILELDPENAHTQARLADLYTKIGRKDEAHKIFFTAAEALHAKGANDAAAEALGKMLTLDPNNSDALLLRGMIAADKGEHSSAAHYLEEVDNLDSRRDALRALLRAKLGMRDSEGAEAVANKLLTLHKDPNGVTDLVEWYLGNDQPQSALQIYEQNADRLLELGSDAAKNALVPLMNRVEQDPQALDTTRRLLEKAGDTSRSAELMEMQAHAAVQKGDYTEARDLFRQLSELEPENAQHAQNYRQMLVKLGEDSASRILSPEEAAQAFMVEELVDNSPMVQQKYDPPTESAIEAALTDAELFVSYNVPSKAIPPLEAALPLAPQDITLNQRLATLYARAERWADAARMCGNLSEIYRELGHATEAARYMEAARKYQLRAPGASPSRAVVAAPRPAASAPVVQEPPPQPVPVEEPSIQEFSFDVPEVIAESESSALPAPLPVEAAPEVGAEIQPSTLEVGPAQEPEAGEEADQASEWESMLAVEHEASPRASARPAEMEVVALPPEPEPAVVEEPEGGSSVCYAADEKVQEIRFYISQQMWDSAKRLLLELQEIAPDAPDIAELMAAVSAGQSKPVPAKAPEAAFAPMELEPAAPDFLPPPFAAPVPLVPPAAPRGEFAVSDSSAEDVLEIPSPPPPKHVAPSSAPPVEMSAARSTEDILSDFVHGLEESELKDFVPRVSAQGEKANGVSASGLQDPESASVLNDILSDLQEETAAADEADEDPETHYNLGIAFKEMGLLDEAIGELQKVCRAVDKGRGFSQPIQAYTWLAQCLVDKGAPEASVRWYQKALQLPGLDDSSRLAIYYDLAAAYEASGDKKAALANFMEVYGSNIDFRDVAGRIKTLKS
ncbi:MAG TPA: tetratricopeptide repeat protein, partial [Terriglobales bacterium]|nr:tetratricopeptide repeat protein [Terriglobales bacterium]